MEVISLHLIAFIIIFIPLLAWVSSYILYKALHTFKGTALQERTYMAIILSTAMTLDSILIANRAFNIRFGDTIILLILGISMIFVSVPNIYWLYLYIGNKFK